MNRLILAFIGFVLLVVALMGLSGRAHADTLPVSGPTVSLTPDPATPKLVQRIADGFHIVDNGTPSTFYDAINGVWLAGAITTLYKKFYTSADLGLAAPMVASTKGEFAGGLRFHLGELAMDKIAWIHDFVTANNLQDGLFKYATAGVFTSYNWTPMPNQKNLRLGPYAGIEYRFH